jgi:hypothetical protein
MLPVSCLEVRQDVSGQTSGVSPDLLAAQKRLIELRQQLGVERSANGASFSHGRFPPSPPPPSTWTGLADLPEHLGWHSAAVTAVLRPLAHQNSKTSILPITAEPVMEEQRPLSPPTASKLYPDLALAMLRENQSAPGRVWLLLRAADAAGSGWIDELAARRLLTAKQSDQRICGWRQLRNLFHQGDGFFWQWQNGRLWLASVAKVAAALGVARLNQRPVSLPLIHLTQSMSQVRAHFYASFHSSRARSVQPAAPISRAALSNLAQVSAHTQRAYEKRAGVRTQTNFAIGGAISPESKEEAGWRRGTALFLLTDHEGVRGQPGAVYLAWQMPNSYCGPHRVAARGRQKRINQELADLLHDGMTGNDQDGIVSRGCLVRRYFDNGRSAAQAFNRSNQLDELYWSNPTDPKRRVWHVLTRPQVL